MTTAHRPTFVSRKGNNIYTDIPTLQFSVKDLPSQTVLKLRFNEKDGRYYNEDDFLKPKNSNEERKLMIKELKKREREEKKKKRKEEENELLLNFHKKKIISKNVIQKIKIQDNNDKNPKKSKKNTEKEEENSENIEKDDKEEKEKDDDEEKDSEEELMRELEKIKKEQEEETKKKNEEIKNNLEKEMLSLKEKNETADNGSFINSSLDLYNNNYTSNSLSRKPEEFSLKKKWYEDTVFRNQSRKEEKIKKRFINDSVHSDFHYKFLDKAIE